MKLREKEILFGDNSLMGGRQRRERKKEREREERIKKHQSVMIVAVKCLYD